MGRERRRLKGALQSGAAGRQLLGTAISATDSGAPGASGRVGGAHILFRALGRRYIRRVWGGAAVRRARAIATRCSSAQGGQARMKRGRGPTSVSGGGSGREKWKLVRGIAGGVRSFADAAEEGKLWSACSLAI